MAGPRLDFGKQVDAWCKKSRKRMEVVFQEATNYTFDEVYDNTPKVTTFLAQSFGASLDAMPVINPNASGFEDFSLNIQPYEVVINDAKLGDTIYGGFVASYARRREYEGRNSGFVRLAAQNWSINVDRAISAAKAAVK